MIMSAEVTDTVRLFYSLWKANGAVCAAGDRSWHNSAQLYLSCSNLVLTKIDPVVKQL